MNDLDKVITFRLDRETNFKLKQILKYKKENHNYEITVSDIIKQAIEKEMKEKNNFTSAFNLKKYNCIKGLNDITKKFNQIKQENLKIFEKNLLLCLIFFNFNYIFPDEDIKQNIFLNPTIVDEILDKEN